MKPTMNTSFIEGSDAKDTHVLVSSRTGFIGLQVEFEILDTCVKSPQATARRGPMLVGCPQPNASVTGETSGHFALVLHHCKQPLA